MGRSTRRTPRRRGPTPALGQLTFLAVVTMSGMAGLMAYSAGATAEGALGRTVMVLFICTLVGYGLNIFLAISTQHAQVKVTAPALTTGDSLTGEFVIEGQHQDHAGGDSAA